MIARLLDLADRVIEILRGWSGNTVTAPKPAADEKKPTPATPDPYALAVDRVRATTSGIVKALAGIGVLLIVGVQFSSIGALEWSGFSLDSENRLIWAIVAVLVGFVGVLIAIYVSASVDYAGDISIDELVKAEKGAGTSENKEIVDTIKNVPSYLAGQANIEAISDTYFGLVNQRGRLFRVDTRPEEQAKFRELNEFVTGYNSFIVRPLLSFARYLSVRRAFRRARYSMLAAAFLVAIAIGMFAWATNQPNGSAGEFALPVEATLILTNANELSRIQAIVGDGCLPGATASMRVIALAMSDSRVTVITIPAENCPPRQFSVARDYIQPANALEIEPTTGELPD